MIKVRLWFADGTHQDRNWPDIKARPSAVDYAVKNIPFIKSVEILSYKPGTTEVPMSNS